MLGYYLFVCTIYVLLVVLVYMGHCCFSYDIHVVEYDSYHCLFNMLYVLWLAMFSNLFRGGGGG